MAGFFATVKAINIGSTELLKVGKEYAAKFKKGEIKADEYEASLVGKIHEIVIKTAKGDADLEKQLGKTFASSAIESLKEGIQSFKDSMEQPSEVAPAVNETEETNNLEVEEASNKAKVIKDLLTNKD